MKITQRTLMAVYVYKLKEKFILTIIFIYDGCIRE